MDDLMKCEIRLEEIGYDLEEMRSDILNHRKSIVWEEMIESYESLRDELIDIEAYGPEELDEEEFFRVDDMHIEVLCLLKEYSPICF